MKFLPKKAHQWIIFQKGLALKIFSKMALLCEAFFFFFIYLYKSAYVAICRNMIAIWLRHIAIYVTLKKERKKLEKKKRKKKKKGEGRRRRDISFSPLDS